LKLRFGPASNFDQAWIFTNSSPIHSVQILWWRMSRGWNHQNNHVLVDDDPKKEARRSGLLESSWIGQVG